MAIKKASSLESRGFIRANAPLRHRIIARSISTTAGGGSTHFWLTAPGPIVVISLDKGLEGVIEKFQDEKEIIYKEYDWAPVTEKDEFGKFVVSEEFQADAIVLRDEIVEDVAAALKYARTVVIDKESHVHEVFRYAEHGAPNDNPRNNVALNQRYRRFVELAKSTDVNFGLIQETKESWGMVGGRFGKTGERYATGFSDLDRLVHMDLAHSYNRETGLFEINVGKVRGPGSRDVQFKEYSDLTFPDFAQLVFPDTEEEDWI